MLKKLERWMTLAVGAGLVLCGPAGFVWFAWEVIQAIPYWLAREAIPSNDILLAAGVMLVAPLAGHVALMAAAATTSSPQKAAGIRRA